MRISDWSSDVCSSDRVRRVVRPVDQCAVDRDSPIEEPAGVEPVAQAMFGERVRGRAFPSEHARGFRHAFRGADAARALEPPVAAAGAEYSVRGRAPFLPPLFRSEGHTSELPSLM